MFSMFRDVDQLVTVEQQLIEMLANCQDTFRLATSAVFGEEDVTVAGDQLEETDKDLNRTERAIRRELLVHGTVRGAEVDLGLMLAYMSIAKDIERIGDYCKNIWNLAQIGVTFKKADDIEELTKHRLRVASLLKQALDAFADQDTDAVHEMLPRIKDDMQHYDTHIIQFVGSNLPGRFSTPRALYYRYLKRISAHLSNTLTSVVMPVDRIDFYKASKAVVEPE
ncbi:MAG TPA: PhoU domain-containing protein, partial [Acidimicrobiia bacterium]|nr:PhoU domain-containing protein [Acidimicrobiia bacterium]